MAARAPSPAILGAILLHAGVAALFLIPRAEREEITPIITSVPVSIVSSEVVEAAPADNPDDELITEDVATAPPETTEPEPASPEPTPPAPTPPAPQPAQTPRPTPPRPTPPRPTPPRPTPPRPAPTQPTAPLDLEALAGPRRPAPTPGPRAPTGQQGRGSSSQATGPQIAAAILEQAGDNWTVLCDIPGGADMRITMDVSLGPDGRITRGPTLVSPQSDPAWRAQADGAIRAMRQTAPFDVPPGFAGGNFRPTFVTARMCRAR